MAPCAVPTRFRTAAAVVMTLAVLGSACGGTDAAAFDPETDRAVEPVDIHAVDAHTVGAFTENEASSCDEISHADAVVEGDAVRVHVVYRRPRHLYCVGLAIRGFDDGLPAAPDLLVTVPFTIPDGAEITFVTSHDGDGWQDAEAVDCRLDEADPLCENRQRPAVSSP